MSSRPPTECVDLAADGTVGYTDLGHERWPLHGADAVIAENAVFAASGFEHPSGGPTPFYSHGVDVTTTTSERWDERSEHSPERSTFESAGASAPVAPRRSPGGSP